jgi:hypothetical protein
MLEGYIYQEGAIGRDFVGARYGLVLSEIKGKA